VSTQEDLTGCNLIRGVRASRSCYRVDSFAPGLVGHWQGYDRSISARGGHHWQGYDQAISAGGWSYSMHWPGKCRNGLPVGSGKWQTVTASQEEV